MNRPTLHLVVMGVSGCGKSTVGELIARALSGRFLDGDALHPEGNVTKMAAGIPLTDSDRDPWLREVGRRLSSSDEPTVIACSALRRVYRDIIRAAAPRTRFVHLSGTRELLAERLAVRTEHFMPLSLLQSQLETLEPLEADELGLQLDIAEGPTALAETACGWIGAGSFEAGSFIPSSGNARQKERS